MGFYVSDTEYDKDGLAVRKESAPETSAYNEEGTEETYPEGFVRGLYTFTDEDGVSATIEYEAGPKIGFVVNKVSMGDEKLDQLEERTLLNTKTSRVRSSIQQDSSENESIKSNDDINESPLGHLTEEDSFSKSRRTDGTNNENDKDEDSAGIPSFTKAKFPQNNTRVHSLEKDDLNEPDEEEEKENPMNAAYRFGFSIKGQSRHEKSDSLGNVNGNYSYVDGAGLLTKVEYEAGAKKGFVIKRMTHEHTKTPKTVLNSENNHTQNLSLPENDYKWQDSFMKEDSLKKEIHTEKHTVLNQNKKIQKQKESVHDTMIDGYEVSPYVLKEYVNERNLPVRREFNTEPASSDTDSTVASGSTKYFTYVHPDSLALKRDELHLYNSPHKSDAVIKHYFQQETDRYLPSSSYSLFVRDPNYSGSQEAPTVNNYEHSSYLPYVETRSDDREFNHNVFNKAVEPYRAQSNPGFSVYGPPLLPASIISLYPNDSRKAGEHKGKHHHKRKKIVKRPVNMTMTNNQNFTSQPDGSYSFAYRAKDHSREQSIDRNGKVNYRYQINTKRDGNTLVIFSTQVPKGLFTTKSDGISSQEKDKDPLAGI